MTKIQDYYGSMSLIAIVKKSDICTFRLVDSFINAQNSISLIGTGIGFNHRGVSLWELDIVSRKASNVVVNMFCSVVIICDCLVIFAVISIFPLF